MSRITGNCNKARAFPTSDAHQDSLTGVRSGQRIPQRTRLQLKKRVFKTLRLGTWNVGSMTGKGRVVVDVMIRRRIEILCVQETRWAGLSVWELGDGFKLFYVGEKAKRNGVRIILDKERKGKVMGVKKVTAQVTDDNKNGGSWRGNRDPNLDWNYISVQTRPWIAIAILRILCRVNRVYDSKPWNMLKQEEGAILTQSILTNSALVCSKIHET